MDLFLKFLRCTLLCFLLTCKLPDGNNVCDPLSKSFKEAYILRLAQGGISNFCGVSVGSDILGIPKWATSVTAANNITRLLAIATDSAGNIYGAGIVLGNQPVRFSDNVQLTATSVLGTNAYIIKYDSSGNVIWAKTVTSGTDSSQFNALALDTNGNIYVVGTIELTGTYSFGNDVNINGTNTENLVVVKYSPDGNAQWAKSLLSGSNASNFSSVSIEKTGNILAAGYLNGAGTYAFGGNVTIATTYSGFNALLVKYSPEGIAQWVKIATSGNNESVFNSVTTDQFGNIYVAGRISGTNRFDFGSDVSAVGRFSNQNAVAVKYNSNGDAIWARSVSESSDRSLYNSIAVDYFGNVFLGGLFLGTGTVSFGDGVSVKGSTEFNNILIVKYDSAGIGKWARTTYTGAGVSIINQLTLDARSNVFAAGNITGTSEFSFGDGVNAKGSSTDANVILVRFNSDGNPHWARTIYSGNNASRYLTIALDGFGNLYSAGSLFGNEVRSFGFGVETQGKFLTGTNQVLVQYK